jgi:hypothetical protein
LVFLDAMRQTLTALCHVRRPTTEDACGQYEIN